MLVQGVSAMACTERKISRLLLGYTCTSEQAV